MKHDWKTTLFGAIAALGMYLTDITDPVWLPMVGKIMSAIGMLGVGALAKDAGPKE